ncbi:MAG: type I-B CRISPR-associated protein Cas5b [Anaerovoracaceae bacterium]
MEILKFKLSGKTAFFKKPEVNTYYYFTYGNIHKVALLGIFGAILGLGGYMQMKKEDEYPEFYEKLQNLKVGVAPEDQSKGCFQKKIQSFNNSVGYASAESGGNLIIKQQWIENPCWNIYLKIESEEGKAIKEALLNKECRFIPYLGSNNHPADIQEPVIMTGSLAEDMEDMRIHSLFPKAEATLDSEGEGGYQYEEYLPVKLQKKTNMYQMEKFTFTDFFLEECQCDVYSIDGKNIVFF